MPASPSSSRRTFLSAAGAATGLALTTARLPTARAFGANERFRAAVIGTGGQGQHHVKAWGGQPDVDLVYVCDLDSERAGKAAGLVAGAQPIADLRRVLDDASIDVVSIATPDHWHTPAAILALEAGKHVYVEKPCSHNLREGQLLVAAQQRTGRLVQHGTQTRSGLGAQQAIQMLREGVIGDVLVARAWNIQFRSNIGREQPGEPPAGFDYDKWVGPAPFVPFQKNRFHYNWHWWFNFGTGDAGNDGVHEIDLARWGLGVDTLPSRVAVVGGKYFHDDDQEFPDTMTAAFEFPGDGAVGHRKQLIFEMRLWSTNYPEGVDSGVEFLGTKGRMFASKRGKFAVFAGRNERLERELDHPLPGSVQAQQRNLLDAIKGQAELFADARIGHQSAAIPHLANAAVRLGRSFEIDPQTEQTPDTDAQALLRRAYRDDHWGTPKGA
jgi:predicted dehydrogenase